MHECAIWDRAEEDPDRGLEQQWSLYEPCPRCAGEAGDLSCTTCSGNGRRLRDDPRELLTDDAEPPEWLTSCTEVLTLRARIERFGLEGALAVEGIALEELNSAAVEAMEFLDAEIDRLDRQSRRGDAERQRKKRRTR